MNETNNFIDGGVNSFSFHICVHLNTNNICRRPTVGKMFCETLPISFRPPLVIDLLQINKLRGYPDFPPDDSSATLAVT